MTFLHQRINSNMWQNFNFYVAKRIITVVIYSQFTRTPFTSIALISKLILKGIA